MYTMTNTVTLDEEQSLAERTPQQELSRKRSKMQWARQYTCVGRRALRSVNERRVMCLQRTTKQTDCSAVVALLHWSSQSHAVNWPQIANVVTYERVVIREIISRLARRQHQPLTRRHCALSYKRCSIWDYHHYFLGSLTLSLSVCLYVCMCVRVCCWHN